MVKNLPAMQEIGVWYPGEGKIPWKREWLPTPIFLPGEFHGQSSLASYRPWDCKELDTTDRLAPVVFSTVAVPIFIPTNSARGFTLLHTHSSIYLLLVDCFLMMVILTGVRWCFIVILICVSLICSLVKEKNSFIILLLSICVYFQIPVLWLSFELHVWDSIQILLN